MLVYHEQTRFLKGRCISKNFVFVAELVQCYHTRDTPAVILKLDFQKAFDSVSWLVLDRVLEAKGFPCRTCVCDQRLQNSCLLMKTLLRVHVAPTIAW